MRKLSAILLGFVLLLTACAGGTSSGSSGSGTSDGTPTWQEQYDLGVRYLSEGNYEEAIIAFTAAIEIDAKKPEAHTGRGQAYVLSGETEENLTAALADFEAALDQDETQTSAWLGLADVYIRQGDYDKALEVLREALEKTENDPSITDKIAEVEAGNITDSSGNLRRLNYYDADGVLQWYHEYGYNERGQRVDAKHYDASGSLLSQIDLTYDEEGRELNSLSYKASDGILCRKTYEYGEDGNLYRTTFYLADGSLDRYTIHHFDGAGNETGLDNYTSADVMSYYQRFERDEQEKLTQVSSYDPDGTLRSRYIYYYNAAGNKERTDYVDENGTLISYTVEIYDKSGKHIGTEKYDGDGNLQNSTAGQ